VAQDLGIPLQQVYIAETATGGCGCQACCLLVHLGLLVHVGRGAFAPLRCALQPNCRHQQLPPPHTAHKPRPPIGPPSLRHLPTHTLPAHANADKVANASPTAASASSDMYGAAAADACRQLNERLKPFYDKLPGKSFEASMAPGLCVAGQCWVGPAVPVAGTSLDGQPRPGNQALPLQGSRPG